MKRTDSVAFGTILDGLDAIMFVMSVISRGKEDRSESNEHGQMHCTHSISVRAV